jgi:queuosine precursor transporter
MPAHERVDFWRAGINGVSIGSSPVIYVPIVEDLLPGVVWWPGVWLVCACVALIAWHLRKGGSRMTYLAVSAYLACIPLANWLISNVGTMCATNGPCRVPVGFGLIAPSGVPVIGLALVLRDFVHCHLDREWTITAILVGAALSAIVAPPPLVLASTASFLLSELADMGVYTPLRERRLALAVLASGLVGAIVDSAVFLYLAFGQLTYLNGLIVGKLWASLAAFGLLTALRRRKSSMSCSSQRS